MSITSDLRVDTTHRQRYEPAKILAYSVEPIDLNESRGIVHEHMLKATLYINFACTQAAYIDAVRQAKTVLLHRVYSPLVENLPELKFLIQQHDRDGALKLVNYIQGELGL